MVDTLITLYEHDEVEFRTNGLGDLRDASSCSVYEARNGEFDLTMEYPVDGRHYSDLLLRRIIFTKPNPYDRPQPFRIYDISKPFNGLVTISAHHISYDLTGYPLAPFSAEDLTGIFEEMNRQMTESWNTGKPPFHFVLYKTGTPTGFSLVAPCSARSILGGSEGTILDRWPGEYKWDRWNVEYYQNRGRDNGITIEYGKNLTDLTQEENCENCWTAIYPYYYTDPKWDSNGVQTGGLVQLTEKVINLPGTYNHSRVMMLDLTGDFQEMPTEAQLRERANEYIEENKLAEPTVSLTVSFVALSDTLNYSNLKILEAVRLCDTLRVRFPKLGVSSTGMCISTTYDVLTNRYTELELGAARSNLTATIMAASQAANSVINDYSNVEGEINRQTAMISGNLGGHVILFDKDGDGRPDELLLLETSDLSNYQNVWRWNRQGLSHSSSGYTGQFSDMFIGINGHISAKFIDTDSMLADRVRGGELILGGSEAQGYGQGKLSLYGKDGSFQGGASGDDGFHLADKAQIIVKGDAANPPAGGNPVMFKVFANATDGSYALGVMDFIFQKMTTTRAATAISTANYAQRLEYSYDTTTPMAGDVGSGVIDDTGVCYISIGDVFRETISSKMEYHVFLQKEGDGDLWVSEKQPTYFKVNGTPGLKFSWELKGVKSGEEYTNLERINTSTEVLYDN